MKCSVIIPYRKRRVGIDHINNCLEYAVRMEEATEIIVVNNDTQPAEITVDDGRIRTIDIYCKAWNSGWARNVGLTAAKHPIIATIDADVIVHPRYLTVALPLVQDRKMMYVASLMKTEKGEDAVQDVLSQENWNGKMKLCTPYRYAQGLIVVQKQYAMQIHGWNEMMFGWGKIDNSMVARLRSQKVKVSRGTRADNTPIHLWHEKVHDDEYPRRPLENRQLSSKYKEPKFWGQQDKPYSLAETQE